ncbi:capsular polysaccharide synthesis protein [Oricola sp.]|uniref:capsular polysaccharide synthesis protein n=1 Tax=Oricola sp. TaxID=1979950 RepID=UPI0025E7FE25|nr:capsular polysaccharide synthesis protein [Oricola sp.]MCI5073598.1 polysaccharide pyruvyl transferase family protein [Oricola sp.]
MTPRIIWTLWFQGWENAPELVKQCARSWEIKNPGWCVRRLTRDDLPELLPNQAQPLENLLDSNAPLEAVSDIIRIELLARYGGVWVDSTTYCVRPLEGWIDEASCEGFFAFDRPVPDRMLSSWFLAANTGSYITRKWRDATRIYWADRKEPDHYFWFHRLFAETYQADTHFKAIWDKVPTLSARGPHAVPQSNEALRAPVNSTARLIVETAQTPLLKLTHKMNHQGVPGNSIYRYLCDEIDRLETMKGLTKKDEEGPATTPPNILLTWFGTLEKHGTIGDLLAVQSVAARLRAQGVKFKHSSATSPAGILGEHVGWHEIDPSSVDILLFVCGPIIDGHPIVTEVIRRFPNALKVGVGVSLFPPDHESFVDPFDVVLAREGRSTRYEDVAVIAPSEPVDGPSGDRGTLRVGVSLSRPQSEFGAELCDTDQVRKCIDTALAKLRMAYGVDVVEIEHRLSESDLCPAQYDSIYADCDLVLTSRFHGAMMAMRNAVPFIALDQIYGGAKLISLLGDRDWPHVYSVPLDAEKIANAAMTIVGARDSWRDALLECADSIKAEANETLSAFDDLLAQYRKT